MNVLAGITVGDPGVAVPLIEALVSEAQAQDPTRREAVETIAVWCLERADAAHQRVGELLPGADDERFLLLADWLRRAGRWRRPDVAVSELARRETLRLQSGDVARRLAALEAMEQLGPDSGAFLGDLLPGLVLDPAESVRRAVMTTAAVCLHEDVAVRAVLLPALADRSPDVRQEAVTNLGILRPSVLAEEIRRIPLERDRGMETALLWALRWTLDGRDRAQAGLSNADPEVRRTATWVLGFAPESDQVVDDLVSLLGDDDPIVAGRAAVALGRRDFQLTDGARLVALAETEPLDLRLAALYALGRCARAPDARASAIACLRRTVERAIQTGQGPVAAAAVESLGRLGDRPFLTVMLDIVDELYDQPMVQYAAACAALRLDESAGFGALLELCSSSTDEVRELAAFRISLLTDPDADRLLQALREGGEPLRGGAALALSLTGLCRISADEPLAPWLADRLDPNSPSFEASWRVRAEYLCARLVCGDEAARDELDLYLLNQNVSRVGLFVALLHRGQTEPLDLLLSEQSTLDAESFLAHARFVQVLARYLPAAPVFSWHEDAGIRRMQTDRLRRWWRLMGHRVRFDRQTRTYFVE
jgi:HEAT repeat protein